MKRDDRSKSRGLTLAAGVFLILGLSSLMLTPADTGLAQNTSWIRQFGSSYQDSGAGVVVAADGVYLTGYTQGALAGQTGIGGQDAFLKKYDH